MTSLFLNRQPFRWYQIRWNRYPGQQIIRVSHACWPREKRNLKYTILSDNTILYNGQRWSWNVLTKGKYFSCLAWLPVPSKLWSGLNFRFQNTEMLDILNRRNQCSTMKQKSHYAEPYHCHTISRSTTTRHEISRNRPMGKSTYDQTKSHFFL